MFPNSGIMSGSMSRCRLWSRSHLICEVWCSCYVIHLFCIMFLCWYLLHYGLLLNFMVQFSYLFSLILQDSHGEGECQQLEFWTKKEQISYPYSAQLQMSWNFTENYFGIYKKYWAKKYQEGTHQPATSLGEAPYPPGHAPWACGPLTNLYCPSYAMWRVLT